MLNDNRIVIIKSNRKILEKWTIYFLFQDSAMQYQTIDFRISKFTNYFQTYVNQFHKEIFYKKNFNLQQLEKFKRAIVPDKNLFIDQNLILDDIELYLKKY